MKKYIFIPLLVFLGLIFISGLYINEMYKTQVETQKKLMKAYVSETKTHIDVITARFRTLPYIVKPFISDINSQDVSIEEIYPDYFSLLEQFYINDEAFIKGISVFSMSGDIFSVIRENDESIKDTYKPRTANVLRSRAGLTVTDEFGIIHPVYKDGSLAGNVAAYINVNSLVEELFKPHIDNENVWLTVIYDSEATLTLPLGKEWTLTHEEEIVSEVCRQNAGFSFGKIETVGQVVTYYDNIMVSEHCLGIAFSCNISPILAKSVYTFVVVALVLILLTIFVSMVFTRMKIKNIQTLKIKDQEIGVWKAIHSNTPVALLIHRDNAFFASNNSFYQLFENEKLLPKCLHKDHEFNDWELCKFEINGKEMSVGRSMIKFEHDHNWYGIDVFWEITEMEQHLNDAIQSAITKSQLLSRVGGNVKKTLDNVKNIAALLMNKFPEDVQIAHINHLAADMCRMLTEVQEYADIEAGNLELKEEPFNLVSEIKKLYDHYNSEALAKGLELQTYVSSTTIRNVVGDRQYFRQIINELLSNAIKFTKKGSIRVSLETADLQGGKVLVKCSVEDTGIGIQRKTLKSIFSVNLRAMEENDTIGLGIIITKKLVDIMGGTMRVASPSPISTDPSAPGAIFSFSIVCFSDQVVNKKLDFSNIVSTNQLNALLVISKEQHLKDLSIYLRNKSINSDVFLYTKDSAELLANKLVVDKDRYQIVVISAETSETSFAIATNVHQRELTKNCLYVLIDTHVQKGNYIRARTLSIDYYFDQGCILSCFDEILDACFANLKS